MSDDDAGVIGRFLSRHPRPFGFSLGALVADARQATGRFAETGRRDGSIYHGDLPLLAGTMTYVTVAERAGECLRPAGRSSAARAPFLRALELFTDLPEAEREALYGFRCALMHQYVPVTGDAAPRSYRFLVWTDGSSPAVTVQDVPWDGDRRMERDVTSTLIDLESVGTLVEELYATLWRLHARRELEVALPGGVRELYERTVFLWTGP